MLNNLARRLHDIASSDGLKARLVRGGLGSAGIRAANRILTLALGIVLARMLGVEGYGVYAYAFAVMSLLMVAAEAGVPTLLMREVAASEGRGDWGLLRGALLRAAQLVALASTTISLLGLLVVWWLAETLTPTVLYTTTLMLLVLPLSAGAKTVAHTMRGLHHVVLGQALDMFLRPVLVLTLIGSTFWFWPDWRQPQFAMAAQLFAALAALIVGLLVLRHLTPSPAKTAQPAYRSREWLRSALPFTLIGGAGIINNHTDIIMLGWFAGPKEVGIYRVAVQGAMLVAFSLQVVNAVVAPQFSRLYAQGNMVRLQRLVTRSVQVILFAALPVALVFIVAGGVLISWVFGAEFTAAHAPLAILVIGQTVVAILGLTGPLLSMTGSEHVIAKAMWISALANLVLNALLIPMFQEAGAAVSTVITLTGWHIYLFWLAKRQLGISVSPF